MERTSNKFLKVTGIIMIIGGALGIIASILGIITIRALAVVFGDEIKLGLLVVATLLAIGGSAVSLVAGIFGVKYAAVPEKANQCIFFGLLAIALQVLGLIVNMIGGGSFSVVTFIVGLILPGLYLYGAFQNRKLIGQ